MAEAKKQTLGHRRTECKIIENKAAREVTFSKRHQGMFRKASELVILCGAEVVIIAYSPHGNPFVFGHPSADAVIERYISGGAGTRASKAAAAPSHALDEHKRQLQDSVSKLEEAKRVEAEAGEGRAAGNCSGQMWWDENVGDGIGADELEHYVDSLENLMKMVADRLGIQPCV
ncbi:agamous-like MADS-box protein AGL61 [Syzygium oleosum]|uniref:agamous-like MADS-box protein AGL61 n=1 Tax=Syzygium oleosum TaxID=219896 RepID=UPI0011D23803|nr:agamous-like MADS-box protein AGL61 [Syzygium oleosum]